MSTKLEVVYIPDDQLHDPECIGLTPIADPNYPDDTPVGHYAIVTGECDRVALLFNTPELHDYYRDEPFINELLTILNNYTPALRLNTWDTGIVYTSLKLQMLRSYWEHQVKAAGNVVPISHKVLDDTIRTINLAYPATFSFVLSDTDLGDVTNEVGMGEVDQFSIMNMLSHFHGLDYIRKAELMTVVAFSWKLDIHPMAVAVTPWVIGVLRYTNQL